MRARFAYISSLGTTAILVAAALLMLALVGAIVAFKGWPGGGGDSPVRAVPLAPNGAPTRVALVRRAVPARRFERSARPRPVASRRPVSTAGLVKSDADGPKVVQGVVMDPHPVAPMSAQPSSPGTPQAAQPVVPPAPAREVPHDPQEPVPGGGLVPLPPLPSTTQPSTDQVTTMVGDVLSGGSPPPPVTQSVIGAVDGILP